MDPNKVTIGSLAGFIGALLLRYIFKHGHSFKMTFSSKLMSIKINAISPTTPSVDEPPPIKRQRSRTQSLPEISLRP